LEPFAHFGDVIGGKPLRGYDDEIYRISLGGDKEASLRVSDCVAARAALQAEDTGYSQAAEAKPCDHCSGTGEICCSSTSYAACPDCKGSGEAK
jgi:RecJ-like exonuclease